MTDRKLTSRKPKLELFDPFTAQARRHDRHERNLRREQETMREARRELGAARVQLTNTWRM